MRAFLLMMIGLGTVESAQAKCWKTTEFPSSFCATFTIDRIDNSVQDDCVAMAKIIKAPRIEGTSTRFNLDAGQIFSIAMSGSNCAAFKTGKEYSRLVTKACQDKLPVKVKHYLYLNEDGSVHRGDSIWSDSMALKCDFSKVATSCS